MATAHLITPLQRTAADIDGVVYADDANFVKPAELGSSWYLRGDLRYNFNQRQERRLLSNTGGVLKQPV
ncbi:MAG: hypothetical protein U5K75_03785 [Ahrensia sp.]|nr:hypothetical protein [Ahrensia sp.]